MTETPKAPSMAEAITEGRVAMEKQLAHLELMGLVCAAVMPKAVVEQYADRLRKTALQMLDTIAGRPDDTEPDG